MTLHSLVQTTALKLPEVTVTQPFGEGCDVFKVLDKMFALASFHDGKAILNLKVEPDHGVMLRDIYPYIHVGWHMNKKHWISIYEDDDLDEELIKDLILNSYELVVAKLNKVEQQRMRLLRDVNFDKD